MIDLQKPLPNTISVGGRDLSIYTDFRVWMRFAVAFEHWDRKGTLNIQYLFKNELPVFRQAEDYEAIMQFAFPQSIVPRGEASAIRMLDYEIDADYIFAAFLQQYGIDLIDIKELHWYKFKALLNGICEGTKLHEIMGYRSYTGEKVKDQDSMYRKLRDAWELPLFETEDEMQIEEEFNNFFD